MYSRLLLSSVLVVLLLLPSFPPPQRATAAGSGPFGFGISLGDLGLSYLVSDLGFNYIKVTLSWARSETAKGQYAWLYGPNDADNIVEAARARNLKLLLRVDNPPAWANGTGGTGPPYNMNDFGDFLSALANRHRGKIAAYEIWNEPNLALEWGNNSPDPERYTQMLQAVYPRLKVADPNALVVAAGLATNGEQGGAALDDLAFIQRMYNAGARGYFDIMGSHPYGFAYPPDYDPGAASGLAFRRAEQQYAVMVANGDGNKQVWATEFGWLLDPPERSCDWWDRNWQKVSQQTQADYLVYAFQYARGNWPWMGAMFVFNLDFGANYYQAGCPDNTFMCNPMRYYSITYRDNPCSPGTNPVKFRPAYYALKSMAKYPAIPPVSAVGPLANISPPSFTVSWSGYDQSGAGLSHYDVQYRAGGGGWQDWQTQTTSTAAIFAGSSGQAYYFQSRATDLGGNVEAYPGGNGDAATVVDGSPPSTSMNPLPPSQSKTWFLVSWQGTDSLSGISYFDVQYKEGSSGQWRALLSSTTSTSSLFTFGRAGRVYYFRVRGVDQIGNAQAFPDNPSAWVSTTAGSDGSGLRRVYLPIAARQYAGAW